MKIPDRCIFDSFNVPQNGEKRHHQEASIDCVHDAEVGSDKVIEAYDERDD